MSKKGTSSTPKKPAIGSKKSSTAKKPLLSETQPTLGSLKKRTASAKKPKTIKGLGTPSKTQVSTRSKTAEKALDPAPRPSTPKKDLALNKRSAKGTGKHTVSAKKEEEEDRQTSSNIFQNEDEEPSLRKVKTSEKQKEAEESSLLPLIQPSMQKQEHQDQITQKGHIVTLGQVQASDQAYQADYERVTGSIKNSVPNIITMRKTHREGHDGNIGTFVDMKRLLQYIKDIQNIYQGKLQQKPNTIAARRVQRLLADSLLQIGELIDKDPSNDIWKNATQWLQWKLTTERPTTKSEMYSVITMYRQTALEIKAMHRSVESEKWKEHFVGAYTHVKEMQDQKAR